MILLIKPNAAPSAMLLLFRHVDFYYNPDCCVNLFDYWWKYFNLIIYPLLRWIPKKSHAQQNLSWIFFHQTWFVDLTWLVQIFTMLFKHITIWYQKPNTKSFVYYMWNIAWHVYIWLIIMGILILLSTCHQLFIFQDCIIGQLD